MQVIGFNLTKISAEREPVLKPNNTINTNIEFKDVEKEQVALLKESDAVKLSFAFTVTYEEKEKKTQEAKISLEGFMVLSAEKDEIKDILKSWKKKEVPQNLKIPLFNVILQKCSLKALQLEEELNLPNHMPFPRITGQQQK